MRELNVGDIRAFETGVIGVVVRKTASYYTVLNLQGMEVKVKLRTPYASVKLNAKVRRKLEIVGNHYKQMEKLLAERARIDAALDAEWKGISKALGRPASTPRPSSTLAWREALQSFFK